MNVSIKRKAFRFIKYSGNIIYTPDSRDLIGIDFFPKYRIEPKKLIELLSVSSSPKSIDFGYLKDPSSPFYFKNVEMTEGEAIIEFNYLVTSPPFGFKDEMDYVDYSLEVFDKEYQDQLKLLFSSKVALKGVPVPFGGEYKLEIVDNVFFPILFSKEKHYPSRAGLTF